jgi:hypothetical protein
LSLSLLLLLLICVCLGGLGISGPWSLQNFRVNSKDWSVDGVTKVDKFCSGRQL